MCNLKRLTAVMLALVMTLALSAAAFTAVADTKYSDVYVESPYAEAIQYCREHKLMDGVGGGRFDPEGTLTRAALATVLYRTEGEPTVTGDDGFTDTAGWTWYSSVILWASQQKLMEDYGGRFGTNDPVTRAAHF